MVYFCLSVVFPLTTRSDCGTETVIVAAIQHDMHSIHDTGISEDQSHKYVPSTRNTKIESQWSRYLKAIGYKIMDELQYGFENNLYDDTNQLETYIYYYVWFPILRAELGKYKDLVNTTVLFVFTL